jgi:hypothetical protein
MQFLLIMGIGMLVAIWVVANQPKPRGRRRWRDESDIISLEQKPYQTPAIAKDISESFSTDEMDYMRKSARYQDDPLHWPPPLPPPSLKRPEYETEYN